MKILICTIFVCFLVGCNDVQLLTEADILEELHSEANRDGKVLVIDTLVIVAQYPISTFDVVEEELSFFREFKSDLTEMNNLQHQLKESLLKELNEINHKHPKPEDISKLDYLNKNITSCDSTIAALKPELDKVTKTINNVLSMPHDITSDEIGYYETIYYISGKVNEKLIKDTVKVYNRNGLEYFVSLTNVLYLEN